jgi:hypothetical protein
MTLGPPPAETTLSVAGLAFQPHEPAVRPLVLGYLRLGPTDTAEAVPALTARLHAFADREGLTLADLYTERHKGDPTAFSALVDALCRPGVYGVVTPSPDHFSALPGTGAAVRTMIEAETGARILVMNGR